LERVNIYCNYCDADYQILHELDEYRYQIKFCPNCGEHLDMDSNSDKAKVYDDDIDIEEID